MNLPRIMPAEPPYDPALAAAFERAMPPGHAPLKLFRTMARNPRLLQRMFAGSLLDKGAISLRERELMILRTCARCGSEYEWGVHVAFFAGRAQLSEQEVAATLGPAGADCWSERDALLIRMADELHESADLSDALWAGLERAFSVEQLLELIALAGYYRTISCLTNACRIELEPQAARFDRA
ncbi:MAG TPA: carboxymuconolactone decarboxylase family protein [Noviherbaspirillum sp.]|uniref:carboxymuconolactone decarboxylase family protein n=1 Tax=Noviherbaspirillum sp. TaxID=1926288 RepID=UPI002D2AE7D9|nr:carboxymuconolactone decarboxylase family protein [Noviherbaspirillum sp.]HYD94837.1 carboxymuconolactone decarboxylase family protein [Noviherbaspirillum sp.]